MQREPSRQLKNEGEKNLRALHGQIALRASMYCLWQCLYH